MTDSYYLINDQIKFYFNIENLRIEYKGQSQALEPKEARILKYVLENQANGLIPSKQILDANWEYWSDKKVLQKVLSTLRKKFKNLGVVENGFVATDSSYKINYKAVLVDAEELLLQRNKAKAERALGLRKIVFSAFIVVCLFVLLLSQFSFNSTLSVGNIIQVTNIEGVSNEPALSPDGRALAFTHTIHGRSEIFLKLDANLNYQQLTDGSADSLPSWSPSGKRLAFARNVGGRCEIRYISLDEHYNKLKDERTVALCDMYSRLSSISWKDENQLFYSQNDEVDGVSRIFLVDVDSGKNEIYFSNENTPDVMGLGFYFIHYSGYLDSLFALQSVDHNITRIYRVDSDGVNLLRKVDGVLLSIDTFDSQLLFKDIDNQLKIFDVDSPEKLTTIYRNPLKTIAYPEVSSASNKMAFVSGSLFKDELHVFDFESGHTQRLFESNNSILLGSVIDQELFYVSEETGIRQIYAYQEGIKRQITNFDRNQYIVHFAISNDKQNLAVGFTDKTVIYHRDDNNLRALKVFNNTAFATFSNNSQRLLLAQTDNNDETSYLSPHSLVEYYVDGFEQTGISIRAAEFGYYHGSSIIYLNQNGSLNRFTLEGSETITEGLSYYSPKRLGLSGDTLIIADEEGKVLGIDLKTGLRRQFDLSVGSELAVSDKHIYYKRRHTGNMVIFKGELLE